MNQMPPGPLPVAPPVWKKPAQIQPMPAAAPNERRQLAHSGARAAAPIHQLSAPRPAAQPSAPRPAAQPSAPRPVVNPLRDPRLDPRLRRQVSFFLTIIAFKP